MNKVMRSRIFRKLGGWETLVGLVQIVGGFIGLIILGSAMIESAVVENSHPKSYIVKGIFCLPFLFPIVAGVFLIVKKRIGYILSIVIQCLQIPQCDIGSVYYQFYSGIHSFVGFKGIDPSISFNISSGFSIGYSGSSRPLLIGVNFIAGIFAFKLFKRFLIFKRYRRLKFPITKKGRVKIILFVLFVVILICGWGLLLAGITKAKSRLSERTHPRLLLKVDTPETTNANEIPAIYEQSVQVIRNRIMIAFGIPDPQIICLGTSGISVDLPNEISLDKTQDLIKKTPIVALALEDSSGVINKINQYFSTNGLTFNDLKKGGETSARKGLSQLIPHDRWLTHDRNGEIHLLQSEIKVISEYIANAKAKPDIVPPFFRIELDLDPEGAQQLENITQVNIGRRVAILVDGVVQSAPTVREKISNGLISIGPLSNEEAKNIVNLIRAGFLPGNISILDSNESAK